MVLMIYFWCNILFDWCNYISFNPLDDPDVLLHAIMREAKELVKSEKYRHLVGVVCNVIRGCVSLDVRCFLWIEKGRN